MFDITDESVRETYEHLKDKYDVFLTTTAARNEQRIRNRKHAEPDSACLKFSSAK
jgi:hypothetical protein